MAQLRKVAMERTLHFAVEIAAWDGESLWTFVDLMVTRFGTTILPGNFDSHTTTGTDNDFRKEINSTNTTARWKSTMLHTTTCYKESKNT
jgi:hypothetical protein